MQQPQLTRGAIVRMGNGENSSQLQPVLQVIKVDMMPIKRQGEDPRYKVIISDSDHATVAMLDKPLNALCAANTLTLNSVVRVTQFEVVSVPTAGSPRLCPVLRDLQVIGNCPQIGKPQNYMFGQGPQQQPSNASPQRPVQQQQQQPQYQQKQQQQQPQQQQIVQRPVQQQRAPSTQHNAILPVKMLNPYLTRWTIKVRVLSKTEKLPYAGGERFSLTLIDSHNTEITAAFFNDVVNQFFDSIEQGKVYLISNGRIKYASRKRRGGSENELTMTSSTLISEQAEDPTIPLQHFAFTDISNIIHCVKDQVIDIIGVCTAVGALDTASGKDRNHTKLTITIADHSNHAIRVNLWNAKASDMAPVLQGQEGKVMAIKDLKVFITTPTGDREPTRSLTPFPTSSFEIEPNIPETQAERVWYQQRGGNTSDCVQLSGAEYAGAGGWQNTGTDTLSKLSNTDLVKGGAQAYVSVKGTLTFARTEGERDPWYNACPADGCNKKVEPENHQWRCTGAHSMELVERCYQRYILSVQLRDHTAGQWATAFDEVGKILLGIEATQAAEMKQNDPDAFQALVNASYFKSYNFRIRVAENTWGDRTSMRSTIVKATPVNFVTESSTLIDRIQKYAALPPLVTGYTQQSQQPVQQYSQMSQQQYSQPVQQQQYSQPMQHQQQQYAPQQQYGYNQQGTNMQYAAV